MSPRTTSAVVGLAAVAVALTATAVARADGVRPPAPAAAVPGLTVTSLADVPTVLPGGAVTGSLELTNDGVMPRLVSQVDFAAPTSDACSRTGLSLAPTLTAPLEVPAGGSAVVGWAGYMDGEGEQACQGGTLTSRVSLDGEPAGTVVLTAGTLDQPPAPTGGPTTSTRAAVTWSAADVAAPGWVLERTVAGTDAWQPACDSSAARPLRTTACTDTGLSKVMSYRYRVTLRTGHWHMTSRPSAPVTTQERPSA